MDFKVILYWIVPGSHCCCIHHGSGVIIMDWSNSQSSSLVGCFGWISLWRRDFRIMCYVFRIGELHSAINLVRTRFVG